MENIIDDQTTETRELTRSVDAITAKVETLVIETTEAYEATGEFLKNCKKTAKQVEAFYSDELTEATDRKKAAESDRKEVSNKIRLFTDKLDRAERAAKNLMSNFLTKQEATRRKEEAERRRIEEEKRLELAIETGHEEILEKPIAVVKSEAPKVAGTYTVDVWEFEIVDRTKVNASFMIPDEKAIGAIVRTMKGEAQILLGEGVKVTCRKDIRARV